MPRFTDDTIAAIVAALAAWLDTDDNRRMIPDTARCTATRLVRYANANPATPVHAAVIKEIGNVIGRDADRTDLNALRWHPMVRGW